MPEGHVVHRQAKAITKLLGKQIVTVDSPQGRFTESAREVSGSTLVSARAHGKHLFIGFEGERFIHVHLGLYGKWSFHQDTPEPVGLIRLRLIGESSTAELRGPTACALLTSHEKKAILARTGPDPISGDNPVLTNEAVLRSNSTIGALLMDQKLYAGVGNIYRAEVLFRHGINPMTRGKDLDRETLDQIWADLRVLMKHGVRTGRIDTVRPEHEPAAMKRAPREDRHGGEVYVYRRDGQACLVCGAEVMVTDLQGRHLFWCPHCQT